MSKNHKQEKIEITEKSIVLTEEEIKTIKSFVEEVSIIPCVECIYILPFFSFEDKKEIMKIVVIHNDSPHYNGLLTGIEDYRDDSKVLDEEDQIDDIISKYQNWKNRFYYDYEWARLYKFPPTSFEEETNIAKLLNSAILFDRFGERTIEKESILANELNWYPQKWQNILSIENVDAITHDSVLKQKKIKSKEQNKA